MDFFLQLTYIRAGKSIRWRSNLSYCIFYDLFAGRSKVCESRDAKTLFKWNGLEALYDCMEREIVGIVGIVVTVVRRHV